MGVVIDGLGLSGRNAREGFVLSASREILYFMNPGGAMKIAILGNGVAGVTAAETIRSKDKGSEIVIITSEPHGFYSRPRLIDLISGKASAQQITIHAAPWYEKNNIGFMPSTRIERIDPGKKLLVDDSGRTISYDRLVIASGADPFVPPMDGASSEAVFTLRTMDDAIMIREAALERRSVAVIGGGLLGIEAAGGIASLGAEVTLLEVSGRLLPRQLDGEGAAILCGLLEQKGISIRAGVTVRRVDKEEKGVAVRLDDGTFVRAGLAVVSAGVRPRIDIAARASIACNSGILVDDFMRTGVPGVYACGDCAEHDSRLYGLWQPAREQGTVCGNHIAGIEAPFRGTVTSARLKVAGIELASVGCVDNTGQDREICEKNEKTGSYKKLFLRNKRLVGAILIGDLTELATLQKAIRDGEEFGAV